jgi:hypothetical protein
MISDGPDVIELLIRRNAKASDTKQQDVWTDQLRTSVIKLYLCDGAQSEARKRGSGGGSPRRYDDLLAPAMTARRRPKRLCQSVYTILWFG